MPEMGDADLSPRLVVGGSPSTLAEMCPPPSEPWYGRIGIIWAISPRTRMRIIALLLVLLCTLSGVASAQTTQCQSIPKASDRLVCYDRAAPPTAAAAPSAMSKATSVTDRSIPPEQSKIIDMLSVENSKLDAKIKTICRGC